MQVTPPMSESPVSCGEAKRLGLYNGHKAEDARGRDTGHERSSRALGDGPEAWELEWTRVSLGAGCLPADAPFMILGLFPRWFHLTSALL